MPRPQFTLKAIMVIIAVLSVEEWEGVAVGTAPCKTIGLRHSRPQKAFTASAFVARMSKMVPSSFII